MSRFTKMMPNGHVIAFGFDNTLGYFLDEFDEEDEIIVEESSMITGLNHGRMLELMNEHKVGTEEQRQKVALDLPI